MPEHRANTVTKLQMKALVVTGIVAAVVAIAAGVYYGRHSHVLADATSRQPTRYTELYFNNATSLPVSVAPGGTLPVNFGVHNLEAQNMRYVITVSLVGAGGQMLATKQQQVSLTPTASKSITTPLVAPADYHGNANVLVTLDNLHQSIHFRVRVP